MSAIESSRMRIAITTAAALLMLPATAPPASGDELPPAPALVASGPAHRGVASYYASRFSGRKMADGTRMRPDSNHAASPTLPLGSTARVTNLRNGRSAIVSIRDRGPYVRGRIIDLSPATARHLGMAHAGLAHVVVQPLSRQRGDGDLRVAATSATERGRW